MSRPVTWSGSADRVMVLAPHPDDESIATGGVLAVAAASGAQTRVVFMTDGENNPWAQRACEGRWGIDDHDRRRWGERRRREAIAALARLGIPAEATRFLQFPDQRVTESLLAGPSSAVGRVGQEISSWRPTLLFVPSPLDRHPDHSATAVIARLAMDDGAADATRVLDYVVHSPRALADRAAPFAHKLLPCHRRAKRLAILCHASQLRLRSRFLLAFAGAPERFGPASWRFEANPASALRVVRTAPGELTVAVRISPRMMAGGARLIVVVQNHDRIATSWKIPLRPTASRPIDAACDPAVTGSTCSRWDGEELHVTLAAPCLVFPRLGMIRIDPIRERRVGFFGQGEWLSIPFGPRVSDSFTPPPILPKQRAMRDPHSARLGSPGELSAHGSMAAAPAASGSGTERVAPSPNPVAVEEAPHEK